MEQQKWHGRFIAAVRFSLLGKRKVIRFQFYSALMVKWLELIKERHSNEWKAQVRFWDDLIYLLKKKSVIERVRLWDLALSFLAEGGSGRRSAWELIFRAGMRVRRNGSTSSFTYHFFFGERVSWAFRLKTDDTSFSRDNDLRSLSWRWGNKWMATERGVLGLETMADLIW